LKVDPTGTYQYSKASFGGTGKNYKGREIADYMTHTSAPWLDRPEREAEEQPSLMIDSLGLKPTDVVADIGAGSGYLSVRLAKKVPKGKVYAVDIQQEMLNLVEKAKAKNKVTNIKTVLCKQDDPALAASSIDVAIIVDAYHEFSHPQEVMTKLIASLKKGGRIVLVEFRAEDKSVPIQTLHKMTEAQVRRELEPMGLRLVENKTVLPWQHLLIFEKAPIKEVP
jgi:FkbM family methyltransferase